MINNCYISNRAKISKNVVIGNNVTIYGNSKISDSCLIGDNVSIGFPSIKEMDYLKICEKSNYPLDIDSLSNKTTIIGKGVKILSNSIIYSGVNIGDNSNIFEHTRIGTGTTIGKNCQIRYGAQIYTNVSIGDNCIIAGFCCSRTKIGSNSTMMGSVVHKYNRGWIDDLNESAPIIDENVIIGYNAIIIGNIKISKFVYIAAGAIVTRDVKPKCVVINNCNIFEADKWKGKLNLNELYNLTESEEDD